MMKRLFALLLALCCLCTAALAEGDVWALYAQATDGSDYLLGTAIPCGEGMLLSVDGIVLDGMALHAENRGTTARITHAAGLDSGALILYADGVTGALPAASAETGDTVYVTAAREDGVVSAEGKITAAVTWRGQTCPLLHCAAELTFGAPVTDAQGGLIGLVGAVWGEGRSNYVVLPAQQMLTQLQDGFDEGSAVIYDGVNDAFGGVTPQEATGDSTRWVGDFTASAEGSRITVDWSETTHTAPEGTQYYVLFMDMMNPFYSYMAPENSDDTSLSFYAAPERTYAVWLQCCAEGDVSSDVDVKTMKVVNTAAAVPFADYNYLDRELYLGTVPAGSTENSVKADALEKITVDAIKDDATDFVLQAVSQYEVTEEITMTMQTIVITPENYAFILDSAYIFMPEIQQEDVWNASLEDLFGAYERFAGFITKGDYTITYYFDGQLVGSLTFTIE